MTTRAGSVGVGAAQPALSVRPTGGIGFDWAMIALCSWFLGGLFLDGWAHRHIPELETVFTPWHYVFYSGFFASGGFVFAALIRNHTRSYPWRQALPDGYGLSLLGAAIFLVGGAGDMVWHIIFGIEEDIDALLSPTHLTLALGGTLIISGPLRSAWHRLSGASAQGWMPLMPMLLSLTFVLSVLTFFTPFAHPLVQPLAAQEVSDLDVNSEIYVMSADGSGQTRLTNNPEEEDWWPSLSPDGSQIAFTSERDGNPEIFVMNADGSGRMRLTDNEAFDCCPSWSADGTQITFSSDREGNPEIYVMNADGSSQTRLTNNEAFDCCPSWSPDGSQIAFNSERDGNREIYVMSTDGSSQARLTQNAAFDGFPSWSPDGSQIVFVSRRDGDPEIYAMKVDGSGQTRLTKDAAFDGFPSWSPSGDQIAFVSGRDGNEEIYVMNADGSDLINLTNSPGTEDSFPSWSSDGSQIAFRSVGHPRSSSSFNQALGVASILLQASLLMGAVLMVVRRWTLPPGSLTLVFTLNAVAMSTQEDTYYVIPATVVAGLVADLLLWRLKPSTARQGMLRLFAFAVPAVFYGSYFLGLALMEGIEWPVELWAGAIVLAGVVGWLLSFVLVPPPGSAEQP